MFFMFAVVFLDLQGVKSWQHVDYLKRGFQAISFNKSNKCEEEKIVKDLPVAAASAEGNVSMSWTISPVELRATLPMIIVTEQKKKNWQQ